MMEWGIWMVFRRIYAILVTTVIILLSLVNIGACEGLSGETRDWKVPVLGVLTVPQEMTTANLEDVLKQLMSQLEPTQKDKGAGTNPNIKLYPPATVNNLDFAIYQLTINDGQAYHQAWFFVGIEKKPSIGLPGLFGAKDSVERNKQTLLLQDKLTRDLEKLQFKDAKTGFAFKIIDTPDLKLIDLEESTAMQVTGRGLVSYGDFMLPFAAKAFLFSIDSKFSMVLIVTSDSERLFWESIANDMFTSLQRNRQIVFR
jgi:hypothetical protein